MKIILTGCMTHYSKKELKKRLPYFDHFIDIKNIKKLARILTEGSPRRAKDYPRSPETGLISISHGCDNFCTYCIVPYTRGREISRPVKDIVKDVKKTLKNGVREIWLLGQNVNSYQKEIKFPELLKIINAIPGDFWIRFTSPHPKDFSDDLIDAMVDCEKFAHYINLPMQSGNNQILKKMGRPYTIDHYKKIIKKLREKMPDISISTDVIVGFPGETRKQFEDTLKLFREIKFDMAFISEYSPRPKTAAAKLFKDNVPQKEKASRKKELNKILVKTALENNKKLVSLSIIVIMAGLGVGALNEIIDAESALYFFAIESIVSPLFII